MDLRQALFLIGIVAALALQACATNGTRATYNLAQMVRGEIAGASGLRFFPETGTGQEADLMFALQWNDPAALPQTRDGRFDILALSSGGPDGAFGAGAIKGLVAAGQLPEYEMVTGVSTGAMIAPFVFAGPGYEDVMEQIYTSGALSKALGRPNFAYAVIGPSLYKGKDIPAFIAAYVTPQLLARIAERHAAGRRLLIATANLDANRLTVWNMGAIAALPNGAGHALFRDIIRAAIAIPGALPPVRIDVTVAGNRFSELHGDGGVLSYFYATPDLVPVPWRASEGRPAKARIDIILHNQLLTDVKPIEERTLKLASSSVSEVIRTSMRLLLDNTINDAKTARLDLRYTYIPMDWTTATSLDFDPVYLRTTYDLGEKRARAGNLWTSGAQ